MRPPKALVLEAGGLSREDDDHVPPKDALCLWRGMLELAPVGMSTTTRLVLISPSASALPSGFTEPSGFWFPAPVSLWPGCGPLWKLPYPQACFVCYFLWASTIHWAEREMVPAPGLCAERHSCILCKVMCLTSQIFLLVVGEARSVQAVEEAHLGLCPSPPKRGQSRHQTALFHRWVNRGLETSDHKCSEWLADPGLNPDVPGPISELSTSLRVLCMWMCECACMSTQVIDNGYGCEPPMVEAAPWTQGKQMKPVSSLTLSQFW